MFLKVIEHVGADFVLENPSIDQGALWNRRIGEQGDVFEVRIFRFRGGDALGPRGCDALLLGDEGPLVLGVGAFLFSGGEFLIGFPIGQGLDVIPVIGELIGGRFRRGRNGRSLTRWGRSGYRTAPRSRFEGIPFRLRRSEPRGQFSDTRHIAG